MARYTEAVCRQCRREGQKLFLKGDRCYTDKCALNCRNGVPGQHGQGRSKTSAYGLQLRGKRKVKRYYGAVEFSRSSSAATTSWRTAAPARPARTCWLFWKAVWTT